MRRFTTTAVNADQTPSGMKACLGTALSQTVPNQTGQSGWVRCGS